MDYYNWLLNNYKSVEQPWTLNTAQQNFDESVSPFKPLHYLASYSDLAQIAVSFQPPEWLPANWNCMMDAALVQFEWLKHIGTIHYYNGGLLEISSGKRPCNIFDPWAYAAEYSNVKEACWDGQILNEDLVCYFKIVLQYPNSPKDHKHAWLHFYKLPPECVVLSAENSNLNSMLQSRLKYIKQYCHSKNIDTNVVVCLGDSVQDIDGPWKHHLYGFSKHILCNAKLLPDPYFIESRGYTRCIDPMAWESKKDIAYWRGASTGKCFDLHTWHSVPRIQLCMLSNNVLDAKITNLVQCDTSTKKLLQQSNLYTKHVDFKVFYNYKYQINIDGNSCAWNSLFKKLLSNSVVLWVKSDNIQWYYHLLVEWTHYIPVKTDFSDLYEKIQWAQNNQDKCKQIVQNAQSIMKNVQDQYN